MDSKQNLISADNLKFITEFFQNIDPYFEFCILDENLKLIYGNDNFVNKEELILKIQKQEKLENESFFLDTAFIFSLKSNQEKLYFAFYSYHPLLNEYAKKLTFKFFNFAEKIKNIKILTQESITLAEDIKLKNNLNQILKISEEN